MINEFYIAVGGSPQTGLTPNWEYLINREDGSPIEPPAIVEVGGGWYKYSITVPDGSVYLGVVDSDPDGSKQIATNYKYVPVSITNVGSSFGSSGYSLDSGITFITPPICCSTYDLSTYTLQKQTEHGEYDEIWVQQNRFPGGVAYTIEDNGTYFTITLEGSLPSPAVLST